MTLYAVVFYILAAVILVATGLAITRRNLVHAVMYLILSFFGSAMLFYLCGAPLLAALEVIIYAGAIMVLFLFIVMMLKVEAPQKKVFPARQWLPAAGLGVIYLVVGALVVFSDPGSRVTLEAALATPRIFGQYLFQRHWLSIEIVSLLLLIALLGALYLGRTKDRGGTPEVEDQS
ncbi:MAG: NADH-quinone oxidoreductase subunit J [Desulfobacterales bacterium]|nr:MAG: NADH-quinone oxidoreductase subunit J [Desulfobacterales bacterium]